MIIKIDDSAKNHIRKKGLNQNVILEVAERAAGS